MATKKKYVPLDDSGRDYASEAGMSELHKAAIEAERKKFYDAQAAGDQAGMDAAHKAAEQIRATYGYSGGADGSQYVKTGTKYTPLDSSGNDYAGMVGMSDLHKAAIQGALSSFNQAQAAGDQAGMDAAHAQAEAIRALYGYSGGADGSQYLPTEQKQNTQVQWGNDFSYEAAPQYASKYQGQIAALTQKLLGRDAFDYDYTQDESYRQYEDVYTRGGQQAMKDTLGQLSARTGGMASSYAGSAAQQAYNGYMAELAGIIPELRQAAFEMYQADYDRERANIDALQDLEQTEYNRYLDELGQWNTDRGFAYGAHRDTVDDQWAQTQLEYQQQQDELDRAWAQTQLEYQQGQDALAAQQWQQSFDYNALQDALGWSYQEERDAVADSRYDQEYTDSRADTLWQQNRYKQQDGEYEPNLTYSQVMDAIERGNTTEQVLQAYEYYIGAPYEPEQPKSGTGVDERNYASIMQSISRWAEAGQDELIDQMLGNNWDQMTEQQRAAIRAELKKYGIYVN